MNVSVFPSATVDGAETKTASDSSSAMRPIAADVPSDTPAGRFVPDSVTVTLSSPSACVSCSVDTVTVCVRDSPAVKVRVPDDTPV